jgi:short subunit dehydrogenase-like uncharacterized protein
LVKSENDRYDVVLYGASGFTGRQTVAYFAEHADPSIHWAIAGRNLKKLEITREACGLRAEDVDILIADGKDRAAIRALVRQTRVVLTTAGPFALYGEELVRACAEEGVDYVDITGETPFVRRMIDECHEIAVSTGARVIPFCGFDSVPSDLGALFLLHHIRDVLGEECVRINSFFSVRGGLNGGTLASMNALFDLGDAEAVRDPVLLNPAAYRDDKRRGLNPDRVSAVFDADLERWSVPFFMAPVNTRVVRRSEALFRIYGEDHGHAEDFRYDEAALIGGTFPRALAHFVACAGRILESAIAISAVRRCLRMIAPTPGEGPSEKVKDGGFFRNTMVAETQAGTRVHAEVQDSGDPGNRSTVKILCESALALVCDRSDLPGGESRGGILTPATGLGRVLIDRLVRRGMVFRVTAGEVIP